MGNDLRCTVNFAYNATPRRIKKVSNISEVLYTRSLITQSNLFRTNTKGPVVFVCNNAGSSSYRYFVPSEYTVIYLIKLQILVLLKRKFVVSVFFLSVFKFVVSVFFLSVFKFVVSVFFLTSFHCIMCYSWTFALGMDFLALFTNYRYIRSRFVISAVVSRITIIIFRPGDH